MGYIQGSIYGLGSHNLHNLVSKLTHFLGLNNATNHTLTKDSETAQYPKQQSIQSPRLKLIQDAV